jgi:hypothetical protein
MAAARPVDDWQSGRGVRIDIDEVFEFALAAASSGSQLINKKRFCKVNVLREAAAQANRPLSPTNVPACSAELGTYARYVPGSKMISNVFARPVGWNLGMPA